jgi:hypothetical protein
MQVKPILTLKVAIVPSWFNEIVTLEKIPLEDLSSYNKLYTYAEQGKCTKEEVYGYMMANERLIKMFGDIFSDLYMIGQCTENLAFLQNHQAGIDVFKGVLADEELAKKLESSDKESGESIFKTRPHILDKEHYIPKLVQGEVLLLVGSTQEAFSNKRAFYNALIECVHKALPFELLKSTNLMKHYLRHAVDD